MQLPASAAQGMIAPRNGMTWKCNLMKVSTKKSFSLSAEKEQGSPAQNDGVEENETSRTKKRHAHKKGACPLASKPETGGKTHVFGKPERKQ